MFNAEIRQMLAEVLTSWQVIVVTIVVLIYITIVRRVANIYHITNRRVKDKKTKVKTVEADLPAPSDSDELELEEEDPSEEYVE